MEYIPKPFSGGSTESISQYLQSELQELANVLSEPRTMFLLLDTTDVAPKKLIDGMVVRADGTNWNPGLGRGVYYYDSVTAAWKLLG